VECSTCHGKNLASTVSGGPHGMHNVNSASWVSDHHDLIGSSGGLATCQACHGTSLQGTYLSVAAGNRTFNHDGRTLNIAKGTQVSCSLCHANPLNGGNAVSSPKSATQPALKSATPAFRYSKARKS